MNREILGPVSHGYFSQRLRLHYIDWGNTEAPPMLLLHGGRDHCRSWDWIARQFSDDWHVIAPDLRGHGDSDWVADGNYEMAAYLYDIDQLIFQQNLSPVMIVAHSLGGNIALRYSGLYPENVHAVVAIEGLGLSPKMQAELRERSLTERLKGWIKKPGLRCVLIWIRESILCGIVLDLIMRMVRRGMQLIRSCTANI